MHLLLAVERKSALDLVRESEDDAGTLEMPAVRLLEKRFVLLDRELLVLREIDDRGEHGHAAVREAVEVLQQEGKPITINAIYTRFGGRWSTIKRELALWQSEQEGG